MCIKTDTNGLIFSVKYSLIIKWPRNGYFMLYKKDDTILDSIKQNEEPRLNHKTFTIFHNDLINNLSNGIET